MKKFQTMNTRFETIGPYTNVTDRQTYRRTDRHCTTAQAALMHSVALQ